MESTQDLFNRKAVSPSPTPMTLQKELQDKEHELRIAYQTSMELIETNKDLQKQLEEQSETIQQMDANIIDCEMKIDLLEAENQEYQQTIIQTNDKYDDLLGEMAVTREHLNNANDEIKEYQKTIHSLNHDILHKKQSQSPTKNNDHSNPNNYDKNNIDFKDKLQKAQKKYDELLRESEKYRNEREQLLEQQLEFENINKDLIKYEKRNKILSDQIVELTYNNVQLEKEINDYSQEIDQQNEQINFLQTENQKLMTKQLSHSSNNIISEPTTNSEPSKLSKKRLYSTYGGPETTLNTFVQNKETNDLKRRLSVQLRDNFGYNSKLVMFANNIDHENNDSHSIKNNDPLPLQLTENEIINENDSLFTMVQNYENNDEYLQNAEDAKSTRSIDVDEESLSELSEKKSIDQTQNEQKENSLSPKLSPKMSAAATSNKSRKEFNRFKAKHKRKQSVVYHHHKRNQDALEEYLHLTASAVKINYPTINATSKELIEMVKSLPFYQAHDHLNRYMMDRLRWEQIQQNKLLQLKAAAIQSQRDHALSQQSTVTKIFKKWFTTEYDNVDNIIFDQNEGAKIKDDVNNNVVLGKVDLSAPLSKTENFRVNNVGKAQMISTKTGGTSVNLGSLIPNGMPPKGVYDNKHNRRSNVKSKKSMDSHQRRRSNKKKRDKKLKSLSTAQTMSSSKMNDKKVQKMIAINADFIDKVVDDINEDSTNHKKTQKRKPRNEKIYNAENYHSSSNGRTKAKQNPPPQKQGWFSWLSTPAAPAPPVPSSKEQQQRMKQNVKYVETLYDSKDPYALKPGRKMKRRKRDKATEKGNKRRKSRSRKDVNVNENISNVIAESNEKKAVDYNELNMERMEDLHNKSVELKEESNDNDGASLKVNGMSLNVRMDSHDESNGTPTLSAMEIVSNGGDENKENIAIMSDQMDTTDLDEIASLECVKDKLESGRTSGNDTDLLIAEIENEIKEVEITSRNNAKNDENNEIDDILQPVLVDKEDDIDQNGQNLPIFNTFE